MLHRSERKPMLYINQERNSGSESRISVKSVHSFTNGKTCKLYETFWPPYKLSPLPDASLNMISGLRNWTMIWQDLLSINVWNIWRVVLRQRRADIWESLVQIHQNIINFYLNFLVNKLYLISCQFRLFLLNYFSWCLLFYLWLKSFFSICLSSVYTFPAAYSFQITTN